MNVIAKNDNDTRVRIIKSSNNINTITSINNNDYRNNNIIMITEK